ncbi:nucleotidyltransferase domain-containing protein [Candidatus Uhrbacteria bacterium]|nr:nucleotidyltransferase domain-containing protein [Candidatus Uhrbacteria bacterium]
MKLPSNHTIVFTKDDTAALHRLGVSALYFFGSRAQGVAGPLSDFDFGVLMKDDVFSPSREQDVYTELYALFSSRVAPETQEADIIDIVFLQSPRVPLELKAYIVANGALLFDAQPLSRSAFEERIALLNADFEPLRAEMSRTLLARL